MEKERKIKTEEEKEVKTTDGQPKSSSNKVNYYGMQPRCNYNSMVFYWGKENLSSVNYFFNVTIPLL